MRKRRNVDGLVFRFGKHNQDTLSGFFAKCADLFSRVGQEFLMIRGRQRLRIFEPLLLLMSDVSDRTGVSVDDFLKLRAEAENIPGVEARFNFFFEGFVRLVGASGERSFGASVADGLPGRGIFREYLKDVCRAVFSAAGFLNSIGEAGRYFEGISEARSDRARHMVLYGERLSEIVPVDDWDVVRAFEMGDAGVKDIISQKSAAISRLRTRFRLRRMRKLPERHQKDLVDMRFNEFRVAFQGRDFGTAVDAYLEAAGRALKGAFDKGEGGRSA